MDFRHSLTLLNRTQQLRSTLRLKSAVCQQIGPRRKLPVDNSEAESLPILQYHSKKPKEHRVYAWGMGTTGALGIPLNTAKNIPTVKKPRRLSFAELHDVTDVASGYGFTAFAVKSTTNEKVFGSGINTDSQLGFHAMNRMNRPMTHLIVPQSIKLPLANPKQTQVTGISAGRAHLLILTDEGLFTVGNNSYGQCGRTILPKEQYVGSTIINHVQTLGECKIRSVQCGQDHSIALTESGEVYTCGWGADGQTGLGHYKNQSKFSLVGGDLTNEMIVKVAGTSDCVLALSDQGEVFGWGNSEYSQLSTIDDCQQINSPIFLKLCKKLGKIVDIAAGGTFCMVLNEYGEVFVWGYGLLGKGPDLQQSSVPINIPPILFGKGKFNPDCRVVSISCGLGHLAAVNNLGDLYTWGRNRNGCLGLGHLNDQFFPLKVAVSASVKKVSCGVDHTMALCKAFT